MYAFIKQAEKEKAAGVSTGQVSDRDFLIHGSGAQFLSKCAVPMYVAITALLPSTKVRPPHKKVSLKRKENF